MARLARNGVAFQCLYEYEGTLADIVESLGLKPLDAEAERRVRDRLGLALGKWQEPYAGVDAKDLASSLSSLANHLDAIEAHVAAAGEGFHHIHDIEAANRLAQELSEDPVIGSVEAARTVISEFHGRARTIAHAARAAATKLRSIRGESGRPRHDWYDDFVAVLVDVCAQNGISVAPVSSREFDEPTGRFLEVAEGFERLLLPKMRSRTRHALAKRLNRSLKRIQICKNKSRQLG